MLGATGANRVKNQLEPREEGETMKRLFVLSTVALLTVASAAIGADNARTLVVTSSNAANNQLLVFDTAGTLLESVPTLGQGGVGGNAGGVATTDAIRSLTISQRLLGTEEVILIHHTDCGMLTFKDDEVTAQIEEDTGIRPAFRLEAFSNLEKDVRQSIARIKASPFIPRKDKIRGFVYDVKSGRLNEVAVEAATAGKR